MLLDYLVLGVAVGCIVSAGGCGIVGLCKNEDQYTSKAFLNLLVGLSAGFFGLGIMLPAVYCKFQANEIFIVPACFLVLSLGYLTTAGIQKIREVRQGA